MYKYLYIHNVQRLPFFFRTVMWDQSVGMRVENIFKDKWLFNITLRIFAYLRENSHIQARKIVNRLVPGIERNAWCLPEATVVLLCARLTCLTAPPQFYNKHFLINIIFSNFYFFANLENTGHIGIIHASASTYRPR